MNVLGHHHTAVIWIDVFLADKGCDWVQLLKLCAVISQVKTGMACMKLQ
jgi:hypothetical protein